ncbi:2OG-Fe(II) oxygenase superfamily-domain-containing protein [Pavlovales sp. CCMP2436]|nr:2OG-Fe(II) oxygenase superfamily-domain-containing protein [Pavlovales sp. CCMP2436]
MRPLASGGRAHAATLAPANSSAFRAAERLYRRRARASSPADEARLRATIIDFGHAAAEGSAPEAGSPAAATASDTTPIALGNGRYTLRGYPGLEVVPGALSLGEQRALVRSVLGEWSYVPFGMTNLGALSRPMRRPSVHTAAVDIGVARTEAADTVAADTGTVDTTVVDAAAAEAAATDAEESAVLMGVSNVSTLCALKKRGEAGMPSEGLRTNNDGDSPVRLPPAGVSWVTLGLHYQWTSRSYSDTLKGPIPTQLAQICEQLAPGFIAEACILKFYDEKAVMLAHVDDAEEALDAPVVSISLGCDGLFLLGGETREQTPVLPILLRSGDALLLGGRARLWCVFLLKELLLKQSIATRSILFYMCWQATLILVL